MGQPRFFWGKRKVAGPLGGTRPQSLGCPWDTSLLPPALAGCSSGAGGAGGVAGGGKGGPVAGCRRSRHALPHPRRHAKHIALRCLDNGNSYTLLFILKDTCSYLLLQSPQKIACRAKFLRGNRTRCSRPKSHLLETCQPAGWPGGCSLGDSPLAGITRRDAGGRVTHAVLGAGRGAAGGLPALCCPV